MALPTASTPGYVAYPGVVYGPDVTCSCLSRWLYLFRKLCVVKGLGDPVVWQLTGGNSASAGTHTLGGVYDFGGLSTAQSMLAREAGSTDFPRNWTGNRHRHGVIDCPHNERARYQRTACIVYRADGLGYLGLAGPDPLPPPSKWRNYEQGIEWMKSELSRLNAPYTLENTMTPEQEKKLDYVSAQVKATAQLVLDKYADTTAQIQSVAKLVVADDEEKDVLLAEVKAMLAKQPGEVRDAVWSRPVLRDGGSVPAIQELADAKTIGLRVEQVLSGLGSEVDALEAAVQAGDLDGIQAALAALKETVEAAHPKPPAPVVPIKGIDISGYQSDAVVNEWLPKVDFVFVKATEGKGYDAPDYARQVALVRAAGKKVGSYHLGWPENGWQADFDHYVRVVGKHPGESSMFDFEPWPKKQPLADPKTFPEYIVGFVDAHKAYFGFDPLFYVPDYFVPIIKANATPEQWERISSLPYHKPGRDGIYVSDPAEGPGSLLGFKSIAAWQWTSTPLDQNILYVDWSTISVKEA